MKIVEDKENGGWIIQNKIEKTEAHSFEENGQNVVEMDVNFSPAEQVKQGDYLMLKVDPTDLPDDLDVIRFNFKTDAKFDAQNEYSYYPTVSADYGKTLELNVDSGKTLTIDVQPSDYSTAGVRASDEGILSINGGNLQVNAIGSYEFDYDQAVVSINSNAITTGGGRWDSGGLYINNDSVIIESALTTPSDYITAMGFNGGIAEISTKDFQILNAEIGERFNYGLVTASKNQTTLSADNILIDAEVAIVTQDLGSKIDIEGKNVTLLGQIQAYDGAEVNFRKSQTQDESTVVIATEHYDTVIGMPVDTPNKFSNSPVINFETNTLISAEGTSDYKTYKPGEFNYAAVRANYLSVINLNTEGSKYSVYGNLVAGRGQETTQNGGTINFGGSGSVLVGDALAGNTGTIKLDLKDGAVFEGRTDDYADTELENKIFRPGEFSIPVTEKGSVSLSMNNATWIARGNSFLSELSFSGDSSTNIIDMTKEERSALTIGKVSGSGQVKMRLDAVSEDHSDGDMLYVRDISDGELVINVDWVNGQSIQEGDWIRFATVNEGANKLRVVSRDNGFFNLEYATKAVARNEDDASANEAYDGNATDIENGDAHKPGEEVVNEVFNENGTNWYIGYTDQTSGEDPVNPGHSEISDAGSALLATARGTYWTSVEIDRLTNRMGDARYANNGEDGLWIRLRQSRLGTDTGEGDFKSDNTVYQVGYDHAFQRDGGRQLVGVAFDYMDTDLDYKGISGEGNTDRYGITAYTTWLADNGFYVDVVGKWGRLDNDFDIINGSGGRVKADYDNNMWAISAEVGRKLSNPKTGMFIEPNAQLQYTMVTDAQYSTNQGTRVDQDRIDSVIGRMGVRIGRAFGEEQNHNIYAKADMFREFMGEQKIHVKDVTTRAKGDTITVQNKGFWFDVGGGFQSQLGRDAYAYADVEYRFGNDLDKSWIVNAGMRYEF